MPPKHHDATATEKILSLYSLLLLDDRPRCLSELAAHFQCSKPTVMRLMDKIARLEGVRLQEEMRTTDGKQQKWYWLDRVPSDRERRSMGLSAGQWRLLRVSRDLAAPFLPPSVLDELDESLRYASVLMPREQRSAKADGRVLPLVQPAILGGIDYAPFQTVLQQLLTAIETKVVCEIAYAAPGKAERVHNMAVTGILSGRMALYLRGWSVTETGTPEHPLFLAVHRIRGLTLSDRPHALSPPADEQGFGIISGEAFTVRACFDAETAAYVSERYFSPDQHMEAAPDGGLAVVFTARSEPEVLSWALSFGGHIHVLEPQWLVDDIRNAAHELMKNHA